MKQELDLNIASKAHPAPTALTAPVEPVTRPWGSWTVLYEAEGVKVKLIEVHPGHRLSLQYHRHRSEYWVCVAGRADAVIGGCAVELGLHDSAFIPAGDAHRLGNSGPVPVCIVEVQKGDVLSEDDIVRLEDDYHRETKVSGR
ncbi:MAG: phosphomannose isomerase type II C-terminal cupin domain [Bacillota bacterium]